MKKIILVLSLLAISLASYSQKYLQKADTIIVVSGIDLIDNTVRYDLRIGDTIQGMIKYIPNLWEVVDYKIKLVDATKTIRLVVNDELIVLLKRDYFTDFEILEQ